MKTQVVKSYLGTVVLTLDEDAVSRRKAAGDTDASNDVLATFTQEVLLVGAKSERAAMEQLASELQSMSTALMHKARKLFPR